MLRPRLNITENFHALENQMHPYHKYAHTKDPSWLRGLNKHVEKAGQADVDDVIRNYGRDKKINEDASYPKYLEKK